MASPNGIAQIPRTTAGRRKALSQAVRLQELSYDAAVSLKQDVCEGQNPDVRARAASGIAQLVKAWDTSRDAVRILRGKPLPGSLRPEPKPKKPRRARVSNEPVDPSMIKEQSMLKESPLPKPEEPKATPEGNT